MGRPKLELSPEERKVHDTKKANLRKQKQRAKEGKAKEMEGQLSAAELDELIDMLLAKPLGEAALMLDELQRSYKKQYGIAIPGLRERFFVGYKTDDETYDNYHYRCDRAKKLGLILYFAMDAIKRSKAHERNEKYVLKQEQEAVMLGIDIKTYQEQKRTKNKIIKKEEEVAKTLERIGKKPTNIATKR